MELLAFGQSWFSLLEFTQMFPIYGNISSFTQIWMMSQFAQILLRLLKFTQMITISSKFNKALTVHPDICKCSLLKFQWRYSIQPCFEQDYLKLPTIDWSCCKLPKFDLTGGPHPNVSNLPKCFYFHSSLNGLFLICPDIIGAVGQYPNAPSLRKCF